MKHQQLMAHRGGTEFGPDNSLEAIKVSLEKGYDMIELDLRKSKAGVIFCFHGSSSQFVLYKILFKHLTFEQFKKKFPFVTTLREIIETINNRANIFLDIKDEDITEDELLEIFKGIETREVILARIKLDYLKKFKKLPANWIKVQNGASVFKPNLNDLNEAGVKIWESMIWGYTKNNIKLLKENGIEAQPVSWFMSKTKYFNLCKRDNTVWFNTDRLPKNAIEEIVASRKGVAMQS